MLPMSRPSDKLERILRVWVDFLVEEGVHRKTKVLGLFMDVQIRFCIRMFEAVETFQVFAISFKALPSCDLFRIDWVIPSFNVDCGEVETLLDRR